LGASADGHAVTGHTAPLGSDRKVTGPSLRPNPQPAKPASAALTPERGPIGATRILVTSKHERLRARRFEDGAILLVTAIAVLEDDADPAEAELSRALAGVLLCYLAIAAEKRGLPPRLGFAPPSAEPALADRLGFRATAPPSAYRAAGDRYMQWSPPRVLPS